MSLLELLLATYAAMLALIAVLHGRVENVKNFRDMRIESGNELVFERHELLNVCSFSSFYERVGRQKK